MTKIDELIYVINEVRENTLDYRDDTTHSFFQYVQWLIAWKDNDLWAENVKLMNWAMDSWNKYE